MSIDSPQVSPAVWPYAYRRLYEVPDLATIEEHAVGHLSTALNVGRVTAFVGSGVSMAYGRITWADLIATIQKSVLRDAQRTEVRKTWREPRSGDKLNTLVKLLGELADESRLRRPAQQLTVFELAEQLDGLVHTRRSPHGDEPSPFLRRIMQLTEDERGYLRQLLEDALDDGQTLAAVDGELAKQLQRLDKMLDRSGTKWLNALKITILEDRKERLYVSELYRSLPSGTDHVEIVLKRLESAQGTEAQHLHGHEVRGMRHENVDRARDPLLIVHRDLRITRFITTNYDHEIERMFEDEGYRSDIGPEQSSAVRGTTPLTPAFRPRVFSYDTAGDLSVLAAEDRSRDCWVVHLHGRAEPGGHIIATERHYRERYARNDHRRPVIDDALRVAFGASPLLFLGIGFDEVDLLRTLREFRSAPWRMQARIAIALLPRTESDADTTIQAIDLLNRYGVYVIFFGRASNGQAASDSSDSWLQVVMSVKRGLDDLWRRVMRVETERENGTTLNAGQLVGALQEAFKAGVERIDAVLNDAGKRGRYLPVALRSRLVRGPDDAPEFAYPTTLETMNVENDSHLKKDLDFINAALKAVREACTATDAATMRRTANLARLHVGHAVNAIVTACLSSRLHRLRVQCDDRTRLFGTIPEARKAVTKPTRTDFGLVVKRHAVDLPPLQQSGAVGDESARSPRAVDTFYSGAASQTFRTFLRALHDCAALKDHMKGGRLFLLIAERGIGKGHFFAALQGEVRFRDLLRLIMPTAEDPQGASPGDDTSRVAFNVAGAAFFNLSFSIEIESVFDKLSRFLWAVLEKHEGDNRWQTTRAEWREEWRQLRSDRLGRLRFALAKHTALARQPMFPKRIIVAVNTINVLFDTEGRPKNQQARLVCEALLDPAYRLAPIDYIFMCSDTAVPIYFRKRNTKGIRFHELKSKSISVKGQLKLERLMTRLDVALAHPRDRAAPVQRSPGRTPAAREATPMHFVHVLHHSRASVVMTAFFPRVTELAVAIVERPGTASFPDVSDEAHVADRRAFRDFSAQTAAWAESSLKRAVPMIMATMVRMRRKEPGVRLATILAGVQTAEGGSIEKFEQRLVALGPFDSPRELSALSERLDDWLGELYRTSGRSRFAFTVLCAALNERLLADLRQKSPPEPAAPVPMEGARLFLATVRREAERVPPVRRPDVILREALLELKHIQERLSWNSQPALDPLLGGLLMDRIGPAMFTVQEWVLWHLSVISRPVEVDVLAQCPLLREAVGDVFEVAKRATPVRDNPEKTPTVCDIVTFAVELLASRCLVFRMEPDEPSSPESVPRYAVHRTVQRHVFQKLGARIVEDPDADLFTLTLYASQPNDVPALSATAHEQLQRTVGALIAYPDPLNDSEVSSGTAECPRGLSESEKEAWEQRKNTLERRMLRAAYGIVRAVYSVAAVARFDVSHEGLFGTYPSSGFFEEHRRLIFWLVRRAHALETAAVRRSVTGAPFYIGDIVWLYNEAGVLGLAQGAIPDALFFFKLADEVAQRIEPDDRGPARSVILLNRSIADIEHGRLAFARQNLERLLPVLREAGRDDSELHLVARGYLAMCEHFGGYSASAEEGYLDVIPRLARQGRSRAASIFTRHLGNMLLLRASKDRLPDARKYLLQAVQLSTDDNHEDTRHMALVALVRLETLDDTGAGNRPDMLRATLQGIERYARFMGMPRLTCEAEEVRCEIGLRQGDLKDAGAAAASCLEIAALNELRVRKARAMLLLARVNFDRDHFGACRALVQAAARIAAETGYSPAAMEAQNLADRLRWSGYDET